MSSIAISALAALVLLVMTTKAVVGPVPRRRVEEFARLHALPVTADNGNQIIVYRATTRRWRATGFAAGVVTQTLFGAPFFLNFMWAFAGWFAGAALAELRVAHLARGPRASASLTPRRLADYLPRGGQVAVPVAMALCVAAGGFSLVRDGGGDDGALSAVALWTPTGLAIGAIALAAQRHVLRRPQPMAGPDRLAADDAIRSRSLHVLAASGMVLVGFCVVAQLEATNPVRRDGSAEVMTVLFALAVPVLGRLLAYWPSTPSEASQVSEVSEVSQPSTPSEAPAPSASEPA